MGTRGARPPDAQPRMATRPAPRPPHAARVVEVFEEGEVLLILAFALLFLKPEELVALGRELGRLYRELRKILGEEGGKPAGDLERILAILGEEEGVREHGESSSPRVVQETVVSSSPGEKRGGRG